VIVAKSFEVRHRAARISASKARPVINLVRGMGAQEAVVLLAHEPRKAGPMIRKAIQSALANAAHDLEVKLARLVVVEARVDPGPLLSGRRRFRPVGMGRAFPIRKRTSHLVVRLAEAEEKE
jgi:large subunit ribosomal protein L22